jgi:tripartite-type tricarboxylate transporter receptor subunit TctC
MTASPGRRGALAALAAGAGGAAWPASQAHGAEPPRFPSRSVRIVVPYSVGVGPDVVARTVAERLAAAWGQSVIVDNKPGASGLVAFAEVRRTAPDGHTLFLADTATMAVNPLLHASLPYDPERDLEPLTLLFRATFLVWVGGASRWRSLAGMLEAAAAEPGRVSYGSLGNGHASHVAVESFARAARLRFLHVPFKDVGSLLSTVASGEVDFTTVGTNTAAGLHARGRLRPLAVAAQRRLAELPDVPTVREAGGPDVPMHPWAALVTVAGTPPPIVAQLRTALGAAIAHPDVRARAEQAGFELTPSTPQALRERVAADVATYAPLVEEGRVSRF